MDPEPVQTNVMVIVPAMRSYAHNGAAKPISRDDLMERSSRHAGVDLHQAGAFPWKWRYEHFSQA